MSYDSINDEKSEGSSKTKGSYVIDIEGQIAKVKLHIEVTKSGMAGSAHGTVFLVGQDLDDKISVLGPTLSETVGAKIPEGINHDDDSTEFRAAASLFDGTKLKTWYLVVGASDSRGFPTSIPDLKKQILEDANFIKELTGIAVGIAKDIADLKVIRTSLR
mgnify:CR=1 FL=1